jgi:ATP-dependent helicase/nuclease subunit A
MEPRQDNSLTQSQQRAVAARGNVLLMAGAGTGKTHTLVQRCLDLLRREQNLSLDEILIVTFTEAAAAEMKGRLRAALEQSDHARYAAQLALFDAAHFGTLHGFCFKLVRRHFHELGLDPQLSVLDEAQTRLLADETMEQLFDSHYANADELSLAVQELIKAYGGGRDEGIRALVWRLHNYTQTRADAKQWLAAQLENFSRAEPVQWRQWLDEAVSGWRREWQPVLENLEDENPKAAECLGLLRSFQPPELFREILAADGRENFPPKKFTVLREPLKRLFADAAFLKSLTVTNSADPLKEDWDWVRRHMTTLLRLAAGFTAQFSARKLAGGVLDFHDLDQFALKLLWNPDTGRPTDIAGHWRKKFKYIFVDEYQDINAAQDRIICALAGEGKDANRFLVGDVKQSIYRFRLAEPAIFRDYARAWRGPAGRTIPLTENFRSRESLLDFVNSLFEPLMREAVGGVAYDEEARLKFASTGARRPLNAAENPGPRAEWLLRFKDNRDAAGADEDVAELEEAGKEARLLALRLRELKSSGHEIWDEKQNAFRPAEWSDMALLLRAPTGRAGIFAGQFERAGVPLRVERGGFYESSEIADLLSLLQLLDNPLQDVPLIAALRSPFGGYSLDELAEIRLLQSGRFWFALNRAPAAPALPDQTRQKTAKFLERLLRWRKSARQASLSQCLEQVLVETHYDDWLLSRPRGAQRHANVRQLLNLAEHYDQFQRQGLFRFLKFIKAQRDIEAEPEVPPVTGENAVRLMSIHQSKGCEFPIVVLADLSKNFNEQDLRGEVILDGQFGLCPRVKPPGVRGRYPSLSYWLAQRNQERELRGEELRLLYVALTRARDTLILSGGISRKKWAAARAGTGSDAQILAARSYADWLALWFRRRHPEADVEKAPAGRSRFLSWRRVDDSELKLDALAPATVSSPAGERTGLKLDPESWRRLRGLLAWQYPHLPATRRAAKSSVTTLRRLANEELGDEAAELFRPTRPSTRPRMSAADAGLAHHKFLQHFDFQTATDLASLEAEARRLEQAGCLSGEECAVLELKNIAAFWNSSVGKNIRAQSEFVRRELPFTARFSPRELDDILETQSPDLEDEFVVVQGVADLAVVLPSEIWIVDFKTDDVPAKGLAEKIRLYAPQLKLYARALEKIHSRPATHCWLHFLSAGRTETIQA